MRLSAHHKSKASKAPLNWISKVSWSVDVWGAVGRQSGSDQIERASYFGNALHYLFIQFAEQDVQSRQSIKLCIHSIWRLFFVKSNIRIRTTTGGLLGWCWHSELWSQKIFLLTLSLFLSPFILEKRGQPDRFQNQSYEERRACHRPVRPW